MRRRGIWAVAGLASVATMPAFADGAGAQADDERNVTVMTRAHPELDPLGVRMGLFLFYPALGIEEEYTDNVFKTDDDRKDDLVTRFKPSMRIVSDWSSHALEAVVSADVGRHLDNGSEDYTDYSAGLSGRVDYTRATNVFGGVQYEHLHEDRGSPDGAVGDTPTEFDRGTAHFGVSHRFNRFALLGEGRYVHLDFDDVRAADGGRINNDDRDRDVYLVSAKASYEIVPRYEAYVRGIYNRRDYEARRDDFGLNRDSDGFELVVGTALDITGITFGELFAGYREQTYEDPRLDRIDGLAFGARLTSNITPITTVHLFIDREIEETSIVAAEGYWATAVRTTVDHELLRNLVLSAGIGLARNGYEGIDRTDDTLRTSAGALYRLNRYLSLGASYGYELRDSRGSDSGEDYDENRLVIRLTGQL